MRKRNTQLNIPFNTGFTLIELVVIIVILAIVAAFVLPRFADLQDKAELSTVEYIASSLKVSADTTKLVFNSKGHTTRTQNLQGYGDGTIDTNNIGYPIGTNKGNGNENIGIGNFGCVGVWQGILESPPSVDFGNNNSDYRSYRHTGSKVCSYAYRLNGDTRGRNQALLVIRYDSRDGKVDVCGRRSDIPNC